MAWGQGRRGVSVMARSSGRGAAPQFPARYRPAARRLRSCSHDVRRRAPALATRRRWVSQLELAVRAGTTQRHLSFIESGRSPPGRSMIVRLAESLGLSHPRAQLPCSSRPGSRRCSRSPRLDEPAVQPVRDGAATHPRRPPPVPRGRRPPLRRARVGQRGAFRPSHRRRRPPALLEPPVSVPRLLLHPDGMAPRVVNLAEWGRHILDSFRALTRRSSPDLRLDALLARACRLRRRPPAPGPTISGFAVPLRLGRTTASSAFITTLTSFATAARRDAGRAPPGASSLPTRPRPGSWPGRSWVRCVLPDVLVGVDRRRCAPDRTPRRSGGGGR